MPKYCAVYKCVNAKNKPTNISLFRMPTDFPEICFSWLDLMGRNEYKTKSLKFIFDNVKICNAHFEDDVMSQNKNKLKIMRPPCLPSIFIKCGHNAINCGAGPSIELIEIIDKKENIPINSDDDVQEINKLKKEVRNLKNKNTRLSISSNKHEVISFSDKDFLNYCRDNFSTPIFHFLRLQLEAARKNKRGGVRYSNEIKQFALALLFLSPKTFRFLENSWHLPSKSTLLRFTKKWHITEGLCNFVFNVISLKVDTLTHKGRHCVLCCTEMSIKKHLYYNRSQDVIYGFQDINGERSFVPATSALTFMVRGFYDPWKQPVSYYFTSNSCSVISLKSIIFQTIRKLEDIGLEVLLFITGQGSNFQKFAKVVDVTPENPIFFVGNRQIHYMFDTPHLLKSTRTNLFKYNLKVDDKGMTDFKYIETFYNIDKDRGYRAAHQLTDNHLYPNNCEKMSVLLAAQVLSSSVARGMSLEMGHGKLPAAASSTIEFIDSMDKLFDILNSSQSKAKNFNQPFRGEKYQVEHLQKMLKIFEGLQAFDKTGKNVTNLLKFTIGWRITIKSFLMLWEKHQQSPFYYWSVEEDENSDSSSEFTDASSSISDKEKFPPIFTRRLNLDCLKNLFSSIRQQHSNEKKPTAVQFRNGFKQLFCSQFLKHTEGSNCIADFEQILIKSTLNVERPNLFVHANLKHKIPSELIIRPDDYINVTIPEHNAFTFVCGYLIKQCLNQHSCEVCLEYANSTENITEENYFCHLKAYSYNQNENSNSGNLNRPTKIFLEYIYRLEQQFCLSFPQFGFNFGVAAKIKEECSKFTYHHPCKLFNYTYLLNLFVHLRLYCTLKFYNNNMKNKMYQTLGKLKTITHT